MPSHLNAVKSAQIKFNFMQSAGTYLEIDRKITMLSKLKSIQFHTNLAAKMQNNRLATLTLRLQSICFTLRMNTEKEKKSRT